MRLFSSYSKNMLIRLNLGRVILSNIYRRFWPKNLSYKRNSKNIFVLCISTSYEAERLNQSEHQES